nr:TPA: hypothetical protein BN1204_054890 [Neospora caninum Liverpool]
MTRSDSLAAALAEAADPFAPDSLKEARARMTERDSEETETLPDDSGQQEELSWAEALDMLVGTNPRQVWKTVNYCIPVLLLIALFLLYLTWNDSELVWLVSGFIALLLAFAVALNWTLCQVFLPSDEGEEGSRESLHKKQN